jgi:hypothetical protein
VSIVKIAHAIREEARRIAARVKSPKRRFNRTPEMAAVILSEATGGDFSGKDILDSDCPRLEINGQFLFNDDHIIARAERLLDVAPVLTPASSPPRGDKPVGNFFPQRKTHALAERASSARRPPRVRITRAT